MSEITTRGRLAALALVALLGVATLGAVSIVTAESAANQSVTLHDPANETLEVDVDFINATDATVNLENSSGSVVANTTISGNASETKTAVVVPGDVASGEYTINLTATSAADIALNETRLIATREASIDDAGNETLLVDLGFQRANASADVRVEDETGTLLFADTASYDSTTDQNTISYEINETDGLVEGNLTANVTVNPAKSYDGAWATVEKPSDDGGIFGGTIAGQDSTVAIAAVALLGGGAWYARREEMI